MSYFVHNRENQSVESSIYIVTGGDDEFDQDKDWIHVINKATGDEVHFTGVTNWRIRKMVMIEKHDFHEILDLYFEKGRFFNMVNAIEGTTFIPAKPAGATIN